MSKWVVLDAGKVDIEKAARVDFACLGCGKEHELPVFGLAIAQVEQGLVFDTEQFAMPKQIRCPKCRRRLELDE